MSNEQSITELLKAELENANKHQGDIPALNDSRLLTALSNTDTSKSVREQVARILHDWRTAQQQNS